MRPRSTAVIAVRVIALVFGAEALIDAITLIALLSGTNRTSGTASVWAGILTRGGIAIWLWLQAEAIGAAMARGTADEGSDAPRRAADSLAIAFTVVGLVVTVRALSGLIAAIANEFESSAFFGGLNRFSGFYASSRVTALVVQILTLGIGVYLLVGGGELARMLSRSRQEPQPPASPQPPAL